MPIKRDDQQHEEECLGQQCCIHSLEYVEGLEKELWWELAYIGLMFEQCKQGQGEYG